MALFPSSLSCKRTVSCVTSNDTVKESITEPYPNKYNFDIVLANTVGNNCVALIDYPDCDTSEIRKVCVFANMTEEELYAQDEIDPHFINKNLIARVRYFRDDINKSWKMAREIAEMNQNIMEKGDKNETKGKL